jgi:hypothetical protein
MGRRAIVLLLPLLLILLSYSVAFSQVQAPIIIDLATAALRGIAIGIGERAGHAIYDNLTEKSARSGSSLTSNAGIASGAHQNVPSNWSVTKPPGDSPPPVGAPPTGYSAPTVAVPPQTPSDGLQWRMLNAHGRDLVLQFYSTARHGYYWPGNNRAYLLVPEQPTRIGLRCIPGEKICYGAWTSGVYWGVGSRLTHPCSKCCRICGTDGTGVRLQ